MNEQRNTDENIRRLGELIASYENEEHTVAVNVQRARLFAALAEKVAGCCEGISAVSGGDPIWGWGEIHLVCESFEMENAGALLSGADGVRLLTEPAYEAGKLNVSLVVENVYEII